MNGFGEPLPDAGSLLKRRVPLRGQRVDPARATAFAQLPFGGDMTILLQGVERGVESAFAKAQGILAPALDLAGDAVAVEGAVAEHGEDQRRGVAFEQIGFQWIVPRLRRYASVRGIS